MRGGKAIVSRMAVLWVGCALLPAQAQPQPEVAIRTQPYTPPSAILRANANLVETGLVVRDARGRAVAGMRASDFEVLDGGVTREIVAFTEHRPEASAPAASSSDSHAAPAAGTCSRSRSWWRCSTRRAAS